MGVLGQEQAPELVLQGLLPGDEAVQLDRGQLAELRLRGRIGQEMARVLDLLVNALVLIVPADERSSRLAP
jgi:hypothetical protein